MCIVYNNQIARISTTTKMSIFLWKDCYQTHNKLHYKWACLSYTKYENIMRYVLEWCVNHSRQLFSNSTLIYQGQLISSLKDLILDKVTLFGTHTIIYLFPGKTEDRYCSLIKGSLHTPLRLSSNGKCFTCTTQICNRFNYLQDTHICIGLFWYKGTKQHIL